MPDSVKYKLAKANGLEKNFIDDEIGKSVEQDFSPNEENAIDRKMLKAIIDTLTKTGMEIDPIVLAEFNVYHSSVEQKKVKLKPSLRKILLNEFSK